MGDEPCYASWTINTAVCSTWGDYPLDDQAWATRMATFILWAATGRQYGGCPVTVRPCWQRQEPLYQTWNVGLQGEGYWGLRGDGGTSVAVYGGGCGCMSSCACKPDQFMLPGQVQAVTNVTIDGVVLDPSQYLLQGSWLVRAGGLSWPAVQDLSLPAGVPGTWSVTFTQGVAPPAVLLDAAGTYACELAKAKTNTSGCILPRRVQQVTRQGVEIQFVDTSDFLKEGLTGVESVDTVITMLNPYGLRQPPRVLSPDLPTFR
jgi:hypothetical protein